MKNKVHPSNRDLTALFLAWALVFGSLIRCIPTLVANFPINDGGLFYLMVEKLQEAHYILPSNITYNGFEIPYAYPPLAIYLVAFLNDISGVSLLMIFQWFPAIMSSLTIVVFFFLAKDILSSSSKAALASAAFAMLPATSTWLIMGGGITRAPGLLFALCTMLFGRRLFINAQWKDAFLTAVFASMLVLTHPEWSIHTLATIVLFWLFGRKRWQTIILAFAVAAMVFIITSPWWITIHRNHGLEPFLNASKTGFVLVINFQSLPMLTFGQEPYFPMVTMLAVLGILYLLVKRSFMLLIWLFVPFMTDARTAFSVVTLPLAMLAGIGLTQVLVFVPIWLKRTRKDSVESSKNSDQWIKVTWPNPTTKFIIGYFLVYMVLTGWANMIVVSKLYLSKEHRSALEWISLNIPSESRFLVVTGEIPVLSPVQEWFQVFSSSFSVNTPQGLEWLPNFQIPWHTSPKLQQCTLETVECIETWSQQVGLPYEYIYLYKGVVHTLDVHRMSYKICLLLAHNMENSKTYQLIYREKDIEIYQRIQPEKSANILDYREIQSVSER